MRLLPLALIQRCAFTPVTYNRGGITRDAQVRSEQISIYGISSHVFFLMAFPRKPRLLFVKMLSFSIFFCALAASFGDSFECLPTLGAGAVLSSSGPEFLRKSARSFVLGSFEKDPKPPAAGLSLLASPGLRASSFGLDTDGPDDLLRDVGVPGPEPGRAEPGAPECGPEVLCAVRPLAFASAFADRRLFMLLTRARFIVFRA